VRLEAGAGVPDGSAGVSVATALGKFDGVVSGVVNGVEDNELYAPYVAGVGGGVDVGVAAATSNRDGLPVA
jgi:hypothetical protein